MTENRINTYKAFWPYYVSLHQHKMNRNLHFLGILLLLVCFGLGMARSPWFFLGMPVSAYAFAWLGHLLFERNWPATFSYPLWSLMADFQMFALMCSWRMDREVKRMGILHESA